LGFPMLEFHLEQMLKNMTIVFFILSHKARNIQVSIDPVAESEVICFCEDLYAMREIPLPPHTLLESSTGSSPAVDFSIEEALHQKLGRHSSNMRLHDLRRVRSSKRPHYIASRISDMSSNTEVSSINIIDQSLGQGRNELIDLVWQKKTSPAEFGQSQTTSMPR